MLVEFVEELYAFARQVSLNFIPAPRVRVPEQKRDLLIADLVVALVRRRGCIQRIAKIVMMVTCLKVARIALMEPFIPRSRALTVMG